MITISDTANEKIKELMDAEDNKDLFLRLGVNNGGCSGLSYGMGFDSDKADDDQLLDVDGLKIVIDSESIQYLKGLEIDFQESAMGGGFTLNNPNAIATCGCGSSFKTKEAAGVPEEC